MLPTEEYFPGTSDDSPEPIQLMWRIAEWLHLDPASFELEILHGEELYDANQYSDSEKRVRIAESDLLEPEWLIAKLANQLSYQSLRADGGLNVHDNDRECIADLLPIFYGLGVFIANCTVRSRSWNYGGYEYSQFGVQGYLPSQMSGYALAYFCYLREEYQPQWSGWLRRDARETLIHGLQYLRKTDEVLFRDESDLTARSISKLVDQLQSASASICLDAILEFKELKERPDAALFQLSKCFASRDVDVAANAIRLVSDWPAPLPGSVVADLVNAMSDSRHACRAAAIDVATAHRLTDSSFRDCIVRELCDPSNSEVVLCAALRSAEQLGEQMESVAPYLMELWRRGIISQKPALCEAVPNALARVVKDPMSLIESEFRGEPEYLSQAKYLFANRDRYVDPATFLRPFDVVY